MRILLMVGPVPTHLTPLIPLAWALRGAGHDVLVAGHPEITGTAHAAGLSTVTVGAPYDEVGKRKERGEAGPQLAATPGEIPKEPPWAKLAPLWRTRLAEVVPRTAAVARDWRPDLILADPMEFAALMVGGVLGVPVVQHRWGVDPVGTIALDHARPALAELAEKLGAPDGLPEPALVLDPCPDDLQDPAARPGTPIRFVPYNGAAVLSGAALPAPTAPRVCVTLGLRTIALGGLPLVRRILTAFAGLPELEAVVTVEDEYHDRLGPVPGNVRLVAPVPIQLLLPGCAAVLHHGGSGTGLTASAAGLPQLVLPQFPFLAAHGARVQACGVGQTLDDAGRQGDEAAIGSALRAVATGDGYRVAARRLATRISAMPSPAQLVPMLAAL